MMSIIDDLYEDEEEGVLEEEDPSARAISDIGTIKYYQKTYAASMENNDQKATSAFKQYETQERLRRLQAELLLVKNAQVREEILESILGKKRRSKHRTFEHWAELMLLWLTSQKRY